MTYKIVSVHVKGFDKEQSKPRVEYTENMCNKADQELNIDQIIKSCT